VGSCRRDLLDHIVALNERHLKRLLSEYIRYHHEDRTHLGLEKGTPDGRIRSGASGRVLSEETTRRTAPSLQSSGLVRIDFPLVLIYMCTSTRTRVRASAVFRLYRGDNRIQDYSTKNCHVSGPAQVLANHRMAES